MLRYQRLGGSLVLVHLKDTVLFSRSASKHMDKARNVIKLLLDTEASPKLEETWVRVT